MIIIRILILACILVSAAEPPPRETSTIYLQPISATYFNPITIASINFDPISLDAEFSFYETPIISEIFGEDISPKFKYLRVGIYDAQAGVWLSSTSLTSIETFTKGYSPTFVLSFNTKGVIIGVSIKGHRIDAGETRDFGPKLKAVQMVKGASPFLNMPVVLKEGKLEEPIPEKSFFQKYWWIILAVMMLLMSTGGDSE